MDDRELARPEERERWRRVVAENVRHLRKRQEMTQEQLADAVGIDRTHLIRLENQHINVSADVIIGLALALGIEPGTLFGPEASALDETEP